MKVRHEDEPEEGNLVVSECTMAGEGRIVPDVGGVLYCEEHEVLAEVIDVVSSGPEKV